MKEEVKFFIHIGMSKAGSSAIQRCMCKNRKKLKELGIYYPNIGVRGQYGISHHDISGEVKEGNFESLKKIISNCRHKKVVLSSEEFWLLDDEVPKVLRKELEKYEVEIIFYLRNPCTYLPSSYRQKIKRAGDSFSPEEYLADRTQSDSKLGLTQPNSKLNFSYQLERWGRYFPVRVRAYEAVKHEIEADFMRAIGAPIDQIDIGRRVVNTTPPDSTIRIMLLANKYLPSRISRHVRRMMQWAGLRLKFMSPIEDGVLKKYAKSEMKKWNNGLIKKSMPEKDWNMMVKNGK